MCSSCMASKVSSGTEGPAAYDAFNMMSGVIGSAEVEAALSPKEESAAARLFGMKMICGSLCE